MRVSNFRLPPAALCAILVLPALSFAQSASLNTLLGTGGQQFCAESWSGTVESDQRLYQACLLEQRQASVRIQSIHGRYASRGFYRDIAFPYCRSMQSNGGALNLVEISFCLEDEITGYQAIQDLRRRYGGSRVDAETGEAMAAAGSWAATANQVKRSTSLKTIR